MKKNWLKRKPLIIWLFLFFYLFLLVMPEEKTEAGGFAVGPPLLELALKEKEKDCLAKVYLTSCGYQGKVLVDTEDLPFKVEPAVIILDGTEITKEFIFKFSEDTLSLTPEKYDGYLTFLGLPSATNNLATGVKIKVNVSKMDLNNLPGQGLDGLKTKTKAIPESLMIIIVVLLGVAGLLTGIIYIKRKGRNN